MAPVNRETIIQALELRYDHYSARAVATEVLSLLGLEGRTTFEPADLERIGAVLAQPARRADVVIAQLVRLAGGPVAVAAKAAAPQAAQEKPAAPVADKAPRAEKPVAPVAEKTAVAEKAAASAEKAAEKPAARPTRPRGIEFVAGSGPLFELPAGALLRIVADRPGAVRWGIKDWKTPPAELQPSGSSRVAESEAVESPLVPCQGPHPFELVLGPVPAEALEINFTIRYADGAWEKDAKGRVA